MLEKVYKVLGFHYISPVFLPGAQEPSQAEVNLELEWRLEPHEKLYLSSESQNGLILVHIPLSS